MTQLTPKELDGARSLVPWNVLLAFVLCGVVPLGVFWFTSDSSLHWALVIPTMTFSGLRIALIVDRAEPRLYEFVFWLFAYVFMGLAPLVQIRSLRFPSTTPDLDTTLLDEANLVVLVGLMAFYLGTKWAASSATPSAKTSMPHYNTIRVAMITVLSILSSILYIRAIGVSTLLSSRTNRSLASSNLIDNASVGALVNAIILILPLVAYVSLYLSRSHARNFGGQFAELLMLVLILLTVNPFSSARYVFGTVALSLATTWGAIRTRGRFRLTCILSIVSLVLIFPYADIARYSDQASTLTRGGPISTLTGGDFDAYAQVVNTLTYIDSSGITWGRQALGVVFFWVPRSLWVDKPVDTGTLLANSRGYDFANLSAPLWSELLINGGWLLLVLGMTALGWTCRKWDDRASTHGMSPSSTIGSILPFYLFILLRGSLLQASAFLFVIIVAGRFVMARPLRKATQRIPGGARQFNGPQ